MAISDPSSSEQVIAEWQEPSETAPAFSRLPLSTLVICAVVLCALLIGLGVWQKDSTYYLAAGAAFVGGLMLSRATPT